MLHPVVRIVAVIVLAVVLQRLDFPWLALVSGAVMLFAAWLAPPLLWRLLWRVRWLLVVMTLIYAFTTPGEYLQGWSWQLAPTYEGLHDGLVQALRLIAMLAALTCLLATTPRDALVAGLYAMSAPLSRLGFPRERFAVRLWLTLHYAETSPRHAWRNLADPLSDDLSENSGLSSMVLPVAPLFWRDWAMLLLVLGVLGVSLS